MTDIVVIFCCSMLGYIVARVINKQLRSKENIYYQLMQFATDMGNNVQHAKQPIRVFLSSSNKQYCNTIVHLLEDSRSIDCRMTDMEKQELQDFVVGLDATNSSSILHHLNRYSLIFGTQYDKLHESNKQQYSVNIKVGVLLGAVLALLLI